jgi:pimeloyl-ACP methyl ester carboxylesterase
MLSYDTATPPLVLTPIENAGIVDGRGRFREIFCGLSADHGADLPYDRPCDDVLHRLDGEPPPAGRAVSLGQARVPLDVVIVPGVGAACFPSIATPFASAMDHLRDLCYRAEILWVEGVSGSQRNAELIRDAARAAQPGGHPVVLVGYSKGAPDILEALVRHPEIAPRVAAVVSIAGAVNGSPLAEGASRSMLEAIQSLPGATCDDSDLAAIESLRRKDRLDWLATHELPTQIRYYSVASFTDRDNISYILRGSYDDLSLLDPRNDSQVLYYDQIIPGSVLLGYLNADHWAVALDIASTLPAAADLLVTSNEFPRDIMLEAIVKQIEEDLANQPAGGGVAPAPQGSTSARQSEAD